MTPLETACSSGRGANRIRTGVYIVRGDLQGKNRASGKALHWWQRRYASAWNRRREEVLRQRGRRCERCGSTDRPQVHHLTYKRFGRERDTDLLVLCHRCHTEEHRRLRAEGSRGARKPKCRSCGGSVFGTDPICVDCFERAAAT